MPAAGERIIAGRVPAERIATTEVISDSPTFTATEVAVMSVTAALVAGRTYRVYVYARYASTDEGDDINARLRQDSVAGAQIGFDRADDIPAGAVAAKIHAEAQHTAEASGDKTFVLTGQRMSGSGDCNLEAGTDRPCYLHVDYIRG